MDHGGALPRAPTGRAPDAPRPRHTPRRVWRIRSAAAALVSPTLPNPRPGDPPLARPGSPPMLPAQAAVSGAPAYLPPPACAPWGLARGCPLARRPDAQPGVPLGMEPEPAFGPPPPSDGWPAPHAPPAVAVALTPAAAQRPR